MARWWTGVLALLLLASLGSAWGDYADEYFCESAVRTAWDDETVQACLSGMTLEDQQSLCMLYGDLQGDCMNLTLTAPALLPNRLGDGDLQHPGECPITTHPDETYLCSTETEALEKARTWLNLSVEADSLCSRVQRFCVASNYLAQTYYPFSYVIHEDDNCREVVERKVDQGLRGGEDGWGVTQTCVFDYQRPIAGTTVDARYTQVMTVNDDHAADVIQNLTSEAAALRAMYPTEKPGVVTTTTSTTTTLEPEPDRLLCEIDSDCAPVPADCCGCTAGGRRTVIALRYRDEYERELNDECVVADVACPQVMSDDISCVSRPACVDNQCVLLPPNATATTTTTTVSTSTTTSTMAPAPPTTETTLPATTTTQPAREEGGLGLLPIAVVVLAVLAAAAYLMFNRPATPETPKRKGLMGLGGEEKGLEKGYSRLGDADRIPRMKKQLEGVIEEKEEEAIPVKDREREFLERKRGYDLDTADEKPPRKHSQIKEEGDDTSLGGAGNR